MEAKQQVITNGQSVLTTDINALGETAALADDRVFAELMRMTPYDGSTVTKGILPYRHQTSGAVELVSPNGATGGVLVKPFRAFIGPRTAVGTDAKKNWRDIRSAVSVGSTTLGTAKTFTANASGNARWDLVVAVVTVDTAITTVSRKLKDPTTKVISTASVVTQLGTTVSLSVVTGTPGASPDWPAVTSDSGSIYYIPIAYVRIPNGFGASSTVLSKDIAEIAPVLHISDAAGGTAIEIANAHYTLGISSCLTTTKVESWGSSGTRPDMFLPSTASGGRSLIVAIDATTGSLSHTDGAVVDSRNWQGRLCKWTAIVGPSASTHYAWNSPSSDANGIPNKSCVNAITSPAANRVMTGIGHTCISAGEAGATMLLSIVTGSVDLEDMAIGTSISLYCNSAGGGELKVTYGGAPNCKFLFWLEFSGVIDNFTRV